MKKLFMVLYFLLIASTVAAQQLTTVSGVYAINSVVSNNPKVNGYAISIAWSDLEPTEGNYNWSLIDGPVAQAQAIGKKIILRVMPGWQTPQWVYDDGAGPRRLIWNKPWGPALCSVVEFPVPWDGVYQSKWLSTVHALGNRYGANSVVSGVEITGVNAQTDETILPSQVHEDINNGECTGYDDVLRWQHAGYTRTLVEGSYATFAAAWSNAFPNAEIIAIWNPVSLPPIDQNGAVIPNQSADWQGISDTIANTVANYPNQLALENNGLTSTWVWSEVEQYAGQIQTGYQSAGPLGAGLNAALSLTSGAGANYVELYPEDLQ